MFRNNTDEKELLDSLKGLVEEFGPEYLIVHLPKAWEATGYSLTPVISVFDTIDTIEFEVLYGGRYIAKKVKLCNIN